MRFRSVHCVLILYYFINNSNSILRQLLQNACRFWASKKILSWLVRPKSVEQRTNGFVVRCETVIKFNLTRFVFSTSTVCFKQPILLPTFTSGIKREHYCPIPDGSNCVISFKSNIASDLIHEFLRALSTSNEKR
jgi:hypothetical protein